MNRAFTGHSHDPDPGLVNMRGRLYDPELGRFISPDPFVTAPFDSQGLNRYSYVQNNPLNFTDPSGYQSYPSYPSSGYVNMPAPGNPEGAPDITTMHAPPGQEFLLWHPGIAGTEPAPPSSGSAGALACAVGIQAVHELGRPELWQMVRERGDRLFERLRSELRGTGMRVSVQGRGLLGAVVVETEPNPWLS